jgi:hypothetical protein
VNDTDTTAAAGTAESRERQIIFLLCLLAAVHVFLFAAAFPFFANTDEQLHLDLAVKYSQGHVPRSLNSPCAEVLPFISIYGTLEFLWPPESQPDHRIPPPLWTLPPQAAAPIVLAKEQARKTITNQEASQPPLYYTVAGLWWRLGKAFRLDGGALLYWLRFLNVPVMAALVWLVWLAARAIFPKTLFPRLAAPALLAFMPQSAFYSIQNDVFSPLTFGLAFLLLTRWLQADPPGARLSLLTGLALAATFLTKISNLPLLAVSALAIGWKIRRLHRAGNLRAAAPAISCLAICAGLPMALWMAWCRINFGDFTGSAAKIKFLGWTHQPFAEWWRHPIFTPSGLWTFLCDRANAQGQVTETGNLATFWQGEMLWQGRPLAIHGMDLFYTILSLGLLALALAGLWRRAPAASAPQRQALRLAFLCFAASLAFFGFLSVIYDFHDCFYPSREHPYFTSGRLMLGALVPVLFLVAFGLERALCRLGDPFKFIVLAALLGLMLGAEITTDWPIFPNAYNWFHL